MVEQGKKLSERVQDLEILATRSGVRQRLAVEWIGLRAMIPESPRKNDVERAFLNGMWGPGKADLRLFREAVGRLGIWMEGWESK